MVDIRFATPDDTTRLMAFMHRHWRADHILSRNEALFRYDFQDGDRLNLAIATKGDEIVGLFGFMKYNSLDLPDLAGSLWKVREDIGEPMLGLRLRRFVIANVPHRYFAAPGAGLQTRAIYRLIDMEWIAMEQYFIVNPDVTRRTLARVGNAETTHPTMQDHADIEFIEVCDAHELTGFPFASHQQIGPYKDWDYVSRRFFEHPINDYRVFHVAQGGEPVNIVVCREAVHDGASALRVVDFYGDEQHMPAIAAALSDVMRNDGHEYVDFVCSGFTGQVMADAGWHRLDFDHDDVIIPNYFEPFVQSNVRVYGVADRDADIKPRLCRADGDQDRPNFDRPDAMQPSFTQRRVAQS